MARKTVSLPVPANPNIEQVLQEFLAQQKRRLKPGTFSNYESVIDLLRSHLNGYAYDGLSRAESALFRDHRHAGMDGRHPGSQGCVRKRPCKPAFQRSMLE
jgi:hypothetical protein